MVDETGLPGSYDIEVEWEKLNQEGFFRKLHEELGLVVTPRQRPVPLLGVRAE